MFTKEKGYVTDPIKQPNGFLILKVEEHPQQGLQPFEAVENDVMEKLYMPRMQPAVRTYLTRLREEAFLEIRQGFADSGAAPGKDTAWKDPAKLVPATVTKEEVVSRQRRKRLLWMVPIPGTAPKPKEDEPKSAELRQLEMKSPFVAELEANKVATGTFLVQAKEIRQKKTGEPYLSLLLGDRTGDIDAKMWDNVAEVMSTFERDDFVRVKGLLQIYNNRPQFTIHKMQRVDDATVDLADFFPASKRDPQEMFAELRGIVASMSNPHLRACWN